MSLKIKLMSCFSLLVMMLGLLIVGVFASTRTINLKGSVDFNISDTTLYVKDIRLQTETTGAAETIENFMPGYTNTTFDLNLGTVTSSSGIVTVYFDFINTTSTAYSATATGGNGVILSTSGTIEGSEIPITDVTTYGGISGAITLTIQLASGTSGDISLDGIVVTIDEYVPEPNIIAISSNEALGQAQGAIAEIGDETTISADFIGNADADFLGWKTSLEAEDFVSTLPDYTFNLEESSPTTYYAIFTEPNEYLTYNYDTPRAAEAELASCSSGARDIIVPSAIYRSSISYNVTSMDASISSSSGVFYQARSTLQSVSLPQTITTIGDWAFSDCSGLTSVDLRGCTSLTTIGDRAFSSCTGLTSIYLPSSLTSIGDHAFMSCRSLTSITIPESVTSIGYYTFNACSGLETMNYLGTLESWCAIDFATGDSNPTSLTHALYIQGEEITEVVVPEIDTLLAYTFYHCENITSVSLPNSLTTIGVYAFAGCSGLTSITIPDSVTSIYGNAFSSCSGLETIEVEEGNREYHSDGNCLIETNSKTLTVGSNNSVIPTDGSVTSIGSSAFDGRSGLTSITIPDSVTTIYGFAFNNCSGLTSVSFEENSQLTTIYYYAFYGCSGLTSITIPDGVTTINFYAFYGCSGLTSITIPDSVKIISASTFSHCSGLTSITIPSSVTTIGDDAFGFCYWLATVYIDSSTIANGITSSSSFGDLTDNARTLYIKDTITVTSVPYGFTVDTSGSDVAGYVKYIKA